MKWTAVVVAAGRGTRFGKPKQLIEIAGRPMLWWPVRTFAGMEEVQGIVVVTERDWLDEVAGIVSDAAGSKLTEVVAGGATRQASTYLGLCAVPKNVEGVFVHDGARPFVTAEQVCRGMDLVRPGHASLLAIPVVDTIKVVDNAHIVRETLDRSVLWAAQTPQFATLTDMLKAHEEGKSGGIDATDDAMLLERSGVTVHVVPGSTENFKVTVAEDHARAQHAMRAKLCE